VSLAEAQQKALEPIWESKTETASRLRGRIESGLGHHQRLPYRREPCPMERPSGKNAGDDQQDKPDEAPSIADVTRSAAMTKSLPSY